MLSRSTYKLPGNRCLRPQPAEERSQQDQTAAADHAAQQAAAASALSQATLAQVKGTVAQEIAPAELHRDRVSAFLVDQRGQGKAARSIARLSSALRQFLGFLRLEGGGGAGPEAVVRPPRPPRILPKTLSEGQMLALRMDPRAPLVCHVIWAPGVYLVPRNDGRLIVGATVEETGFDTSLTAGGLLALLEPAWRAVPAIEQLAIDEIWVGHRPGSRDDAPILGPSAVPGLVYATGHHRNGILLAPVTAQAIARLVLGGAVDETIRPFAIARFARSSAVAAAPAITRA